KNRKLCSLTVSLQVYISLLKDTNFQHQARKCFSLNTAKQSSKATCLQAGGQLASPKTSTENAAIQQIVARHNKAAYLGMNDLQAEGTYKHLNGEVVEYTNWAAEEPNNAGGKEDCIEIYLDGKWNDRSCTERRLIVCEF
uniref:C-type lectin domain-containing protein n=1 Tax=Anolis carolinensis TaxID=28377 RepID=A0A803T193_ANOCA